MVSGIKIFLVLFSFFLLMQPINADYLNTASDFSGMPTYSAIQFSSNVTFNETWQAVGEIVSLNSNRSNANILSQNQVSVKDYPSNKTKTASATISPVTITKDPVTDRKYASNQIVVRFKFQNTGPSISNDKIRMVHEKFGAKIKKDFSAEGLVGVQVVVLPNGTDIHSAIREYQSDPDVLYAEPDYVISIPPDQTGPIVSDTNPLQILSTPDDPLFSDLWGLHNTGQAGGTPGADINATSAWDISTGSNSVIVAVVDTGVQYTHSDLSANIWTNPGEVPNNGIDDDHNGYADDVHGWNFITNTSDSLDDNGHGTHVSGTIGAVGNNGIGVTGVNWHTKIMALKAFDAGGSGTTSDAVSAILYANANGASVISNSWSGQYPDQFLEDAINISPAVVVCAAGNFPEQPEKNNDITPQYPASYTSENIISVAATDQNDQLASFSHYGQNSVDLAAPGKNIWSTINDGTYGYKSGTSMATPHVSGVAALVKSVNQSLTAVQIKNIILSTVDKKSSLSGNVSTGGRLNAYEALLATPPSRPIADFTGTPTNGTVPLTVMFTDLSANLPTGWVWVFGDGNTTNSTEQNPVHSYLNSGNYTVSLTVSNAQGSSTITKSGYLNISTPIANFIGTPQKGITPLTVAFLDLSTNRPTVWNWTFGDGTTTNSTEQNPVHTFFTPGTYDISLNASNSGGFTTVTKVGYITVSEAKAPYNAGVYRPTTHMFYLRNGTGLSWTTTAIDWGLSTDLPVTGDWNGDGITDVGVYRPTTHMFYLRNGTSLSWTTIVIDWGLSTDLPVTGDWNGDGITDVGVYRPTTHMFYLRNGTSLSWTTIVIDWGQSTDLPLTGRW